MIVCVLLKVSQGTQNPDEKHMDRETVFFFTQIGVNKSYQVGLQAQANFSAPTFEPAHEACAGKRAALSVNLSQLQLRCSNSITGLQASSARSELSAK